MVNMSQNTDIPHTSNVSLGPSHLVHAIAHHSSLFPVMAPHHALLRTSETPRREQTGSCSSFLTTDGVVNPQRGHGRGKP